MKKLSTLSNFENNIFSKSLLTLKFHLKLSLSLLILVISTDFTYAEDGWQNRIPNGKKNSCMNCHFSMAGGSRNVFGSAYKSNGKKWSAALAKLDSDKDGHTNGEELQDPTGAWTTAMNNTFGDPTLVTLPGDKNSFPTFIETIQEGLVSFAFPNPAYASTKFTISNIFNGGVTINTFDLNGNIIKSETIYNTGEFEYIWNSTNSNNAPLTEDIYLIEFIIDNKSIFRKVIIE